MTKEMKETVLKELIKGGLAFVVMGIAIYYFWQENTRNNEEIRQEVKALRLETKECSKNQNVLLNQIEKNTEALEKTNELVQNITNRDKYGSYRRL
jgi:uncharacterized protein HemX